METAISDAMIHLILALLISLNARAVDVAFIDYRDDNGKLIQLEPGGRFLHVAIKYRGRWLHAFPNGGVQLDISMDEYGHSVTILRDRKVPEPSSNLVQYWLGKPFDLKYKWGNPNATYCTRLVAELLGIPPTPMTFGSEHWKNHASPPVGEMGLSPDDLYRALLERGYKVVSSCERELETQ